MTTPAEQLNAEVGDRLGPYREVASDSTDALHRDTCDEVERLMATEPDVAARVIVDLCGQPGWWWRSPLGMWCAEALAGVDARVSYRDAADMLGVGVAQVHELMWAKALGAPAPNEVTAQSVHSLLSRRVASEGPGVANPYLAWVDE